MHQEILLSGIARDSMGPVLTLAAAFVGMDTDRLFISFAFHSNLLPKAQRRSKAFLEKRQPNPTVQ